MSDGRLGARALRWRAEQLYSQQPGDIGFKLLEEAGEFAKAAIGKMEHRAGRGDPVQEAAQTVTLIAAILELVAPGADLYDAIEAEMRKSGAEAPIRYVVDPGAGDPQEAQTECPTCGQIIYGDDEVDRWNELIRKGETAEMDVARITEIAADHWDEILQLREHIRGLQVAPRE